MILYSPSFSYPNDLPTLLTASQPSCRICTHTHTQTQHHFCCYRRQTQPPHQGLRCFKIIYHVLAPHIASHSLFSKPTTTTTTETTKGNHESMLLALLVLVAVVAAYSISLFLVWFAYFVAASTPGLLRCDGRRCCCVYFVYKHNTKTSAQIAHKT